MTSAPVLTCDRLQVAYGPIKAVRGCSLEVREGETVAVVGANGAGKTTLLRAVCNMIPWSGGGVLYQGRATAGMSTHLLVRDGILHIPEGRGVIGSLTVLENLRLAYHARVVERDFAVMLEQVFEHFPRLGERRNQRAGSMSGGEQQMLALARAVVSPPRILLLDEPSLGLSPIMVREAYKVLHGFRARGMTILLVEQNVRAALKFAHRGYVLRQGAIVRQGSGEELLADAELFNQYLGVSMPTERAKS
jgi:branched-chain amino acid transport system ATP-binding protein